MTPGRFSGEEHRWRVRVCPGYLITPGGDEIVVAQAVDFDLAGNWYQAVDPCARPSPCPPVGLAAAAGETRIYYLVVCYRECYTRPVRVHSAGCGCADADCEYSRLRDSFELVLLPDRPDGGPSEEADKQWKEAMRQWLISFRAGTLTPAPIPPDLTSPEGSCVVLASIILPAKTSDKVSAANIHDERRPLFGPTVVELPAHPGLEVLVHLAGQGDQLFHDNEFAGTRGESRALQGFRMDFAPPVPGLGIEYQAKLQNGPEPTDADWTHAGVFVGTRDPAGIMDRFRIRLTGTEAPNFDVRYMAHVQNLGDTDFSANGQFCGSPASQSLRVEGMLVRIDPK